MKTHAMIALALISLPRPVTAQDPDTRVAQLTMLRQAGLPEAVSILGRMQSGSAAAQWARMVGTAAGVVTGILEIGDGFLVLADRRAESALRSADPTCDIVPDYCAALTLSGAEAIRPAGGPVPSTVVDTRLQRFDAWAEGAASESTPAGLVPTLDLPYLARPFASLVSDTGGEESFVVDRELVAAIGGTPRKVTIALGDGIDRGAFLWRQADGDLSGVTDGFQAQNVILTETPNGWVGRLDEAERRWYLVPVAAGYRAITVPGDTLGSEGVPLLPPSSVVDSAGPGLSADAGRFTRPELCSPSDAVDVLWLFSIGAAGRLNHLLPGLSPADAAALWTAELNALSRPYRFRVAAVEILPGSPDQTRISVALPQLREGRGPFSSVPGLRQFHRADLVHLVVDPGWGPEIEPWPDVCGLAWVIRAPAHGEYGYSAANLLCQLVRRTSIHEIGHNLGMEHEEGGDGRPVGAFPYSNGFASAGYSTLMARSGRRAPLLSSPSNRFPDGTGAGREDTRNLDTLASTHCWVRDFR